MHWRVRRLQVSCSPVNVQSLPPQDSRAGWARLSVPLAQFAGGASGGFNGCGGLGFWDVSAIELRNAAGGTQTVCLASVALLP